MVPTSTPPRYGMWAVVPTMGSLGSASPLLPPPPASSPPSFFFSPPSLSGWGRHLSLGRWGFLLGGSPHRRWTRRKYQGCRARCSSPTPTSSCSRWWSCSPGFLEGGGGGGTLICKGGGVGGGGGACPFPFLFYLLCLPTPHLPPNPPILTSQPLHLRHVCRLAGLAGP